MSAVLDADSLNRLRAARALNLDPQTLGIAPFGMNAPVDPRVAGASTPAQGYHAPFNAPSYAVRNPTLTGDGPPNGYTGGGFGKPVIQRPGEVNNPSPAPRTDLPGTRQTPPAASDPTGGSTTGDGPPTTDPNTLTGGPTDTSTNPISPFADTPPSVIVPGSSSGSGSPNYAIAIVAMLAIVGILWYAHAHAGVKPGAAKPADVPSIHPPRFVANAH